MCPGRLAICLFAIASGGLAIAAAQFLTGISAASGSIRGGALPREVAAMFSLPPMNLLTLIAPDFFGGAHSTYWGKWYWWEMTLFTGVVGVLLAIVGMVGGRIKARWAMLGTIAMTLLLAFGKYTPLFDLLYRLPVMNSLRGLVKFSFGASLFVALLAGSGLDAVIALRRRWLPITLSAAAIAIAAIAAAAWIHLAAAPPSAATIWQMRGWRSVVTSLDRGKPGEVCQINLDTHLYDDVGFLKETAAQSARSLLMAGLWLLAAAGLLYFSAYHPAAGYVLLILAAAEMLIFAAGHRPTFTPGFLLPQWAGQVAITDQAEHRVLNVFNPNEAMSTGFDDAWGFGPELRRRYAEFMYFAAGEQLEKTSQDNPFDQFARPRMLEIARLSHALETDANGQLRHKSFADAMDCFNLLDNWRVLEGRDNVLAAMGDPSFDPRKTVILERQPKFGASSTAAAQAPAAAPASSPAATSPPLRGNVKCISSSTDDMVLEADVPAPTILLITDAYDRGWRVRALAGSSQSEYELLPADWAFRAVPLSAGHHRLQVEYRPLTFTAGKWISFVALGLYVAACAGWWLGKARLSHLNRS